MENCKGCVHKKASSNRSEICTFNPPVPQLIQTQDKFGSQMNVISIFPAVSDTAQRCSKYVPDPQMSLLA